MPAHASIAAPGCSYPGLVIVVRRAKEEQEALQLIAEARTRLDAMRAEVQVRREARAANHQPNRPGKRLQPGFQKTNGPR